MDVTIQLDDEDLAQISHSSEGSDEELEMDENELQLTYDVIDTPCPVDSGAKNMGTESSSPTTNSQPNPSEYYGMLARVRQECRQLREHNEYLTMKNRELIEQHSHFQDDLSRLASQHQQELTHFKTEAQKVPFLEDRVRQLQAECDATRSSTEQLASIKSALNQEKELDILSVKKQLMQEKERQLNELKLGWQHEKEQLHAQWQHETAQYVSTQRHLELQLEEAQARLKQLSTSKQSVSTMTDMTSDDMSSTLVDLQSRLLVREDELLDARKVIASFEQQIAQLKQQQQHSDDEMVRKVDHDKIIDAIKRQCSIAYDKAIEQYKSEYIKLIGKLKDRIKSERRQREDERTNLTNRLNEYADLASQHKAAVAELKIQHQQDLTTLEKELNNRHEDAMRTMKEKYLDTLKQMRDDVAASKERSATRMKQTWERKKTELNRLWEGKLDELRDYYESKLKLSTSVQHRPLRSSSRANQLF